VVRGLVAIYAIGLLTAGGTDAQRLRFDDEASWGAWVLPLGAIEITPSGGLVAVPLRAGFNAASNAPDFGGGIWQVSSNRQTAALTIDGDLSTGWRPDGSEAEAAAVLEINLGRAVSTHSVTVLFATDAPAFELFRVLMSTGEPQVDIVGNPLPDKVVYRKIDRFAENSSHEVTIEFDPQQEPPIQYVRIEPLIFHPDARIVEIQVNSFGDNAVLGLIPRGGSADVVIGLGRSELDLPLAAVSGLIDGSMPTRMFFGATPGRGTQDIDAHIILDLGAVYWIDHVRLVGEAMSFRRFQFKDYTVMTSDGSLAPDGTLIWDRKFSGRATTQDNQRGFTDHTFDQAPVRLVRLLWKFWDGACAVALAGGGQVAASGSCNARGVMQELQAFGGGFPQDLRMQSQILDMGQRRNFGVVEWQGSMPTGTRIEIRSRSGDEVVERLIYRDRNGKEVTERGWGKLIPSFRGPIDRLQATGGDWSPWSTSYVNSGEQFLSPSPRRYVQLEVGLLTQEPDVAPSLDWLQISHAPPLALRALGEVSPTQVEAGIRQEFSYFVRTDTESAGFDGLVVEASAPPAFVQAFLAGESIDAGVETTELGFRISLPRRVAGGELLELQFTSVVFLHGTSFEAFLEDSRQPGDRQRVDAGDATSQVESNSNVVGLPVGGDILANAVFSTAVVTPNGDGINDQLVVDVDVANILLPRPLTLRVFDLAGRRVFEQERLVLSGRQQLVWEIVQRAGSMAPGIYVLKLEILGDARSQVIRRTVALAF